MVDWGQGEYERVAKGLVPAAEAAVARLAPRPGERVLDVGCGTGNAALAAARAGAEVVGLDPAPRLLDITRSRAAAEGLEVEVVEGDAVALPFEDDTFDAAVSVFAVIFADGRQAGSELLRVVRPGGRIVVTTWVPEGPIHRMGLIVGEALGAPPPRHVWSDPDVLRSLFAPHDVELQEEPLAFTATSPEAYLDQQRRHPMSLASEGSLRERGVYEQTMDRLLQNLREANEDPAAFRTTSRYRIATISA